MKKMIMMWTAALLLVSAVPVLAAEAQDGQNGQDNNRPPYCRQQGDQNGQGQGCGGPHRGCRW